MKRRAKVPPGFCERDYYWYPTREERILDRLWEMKKEWDDQELVYYCRKAREFGEQIARDREWLERQNALEAELNAIQTYYRIEREKELAAEDKARREKSRQLLKEINGDMAKLERTELMRRGVVRGRRSNAIHEEHTR
jgi:hypothetical protein